MGLEAGGGVGGAVRAVQAGHVARVQHAAAARVKSAAPRRRRATVRASVETGGRGGGHTCPQQEHCGT